LYLLVPQYGYLTSSTCFYWFWHMFIPVFLSYCTPVSLHMLKCSCALTLSCILYTIIIIIIIYKLEQILKSPNGTSILQQSRVVCLSFSILRHICNKCSAPICTVIRFKTYRCYVKSRILPNVMYNVIFV
jgi:hypothetical protein